MSSAGHVPVLVERVVSLVEPALQVGGSVFVDATLGLAGHAEAVLDRCPNARLIGIDRDQQALQLAEERLRRFAGRTTLLATSFERLDQALTELGAGEVDAMLFDLGLSSLQVDAASRGFSYATDVPLDMRMDQSGGGTAADILNDYDELRLAEVLWRYGEERFSRQIAAGVVRARRSRPLTSSAQLVDVIRAAVPAAARRRGGHPAKRTFQALRIEVNAELTALGTALPAAIGWVCVGGRIVVLAYHSLEDRLVKRELVSRSRPDIPADLPLVSALAQPELRLLTRGAEKATAEEVARNPRARSARLRAAERVRAAA